jgi:hypothetical protein
MVDRGREGRDTVKEHPSNRPKVKGREIKVKDTYTESNRT